MTTNVGSGSSTSAAAETSIYEAIGGRAAVTAAVERLYARLLADPELSRFFPGGVGARHLAYVVTVLGEALGGPERYRGRSIVDAHHSLGITDAHFARTAGHLADALDDLAVPRHLTERIVGIVAGLRPAVVTA
jgi:hemoglobin